jgi:hypothetical protein
VLAGADGQIQIVQNHAVAARHAHLAHLKKFLLAIRRLFRRAERIFVLPAFHNLSLKESRAKNRGVEQAAPRWPLRQLRLKRL